MCIYCDNFNKKSDGILRSLFFSEIKYNFMRIMYCEIKKNRFFPRLILRAGAMSCVILILMERNSNMEKKSIEFFNSFQIT